MIAPPIAPRLARSRSRSGAFCSDAAGGMWCRSSDGALMFAGKTDRPAGLPFQAAGSVGPRPPHQQRRGVLCGAHDHKQADVAPFGDAVCPSRPLKASCSIWFHQTSSRRIRRCRRSATVKGRAVPEVVAVGHTDAMGSASANFALGLKQAGAVRELLNASGLDAATVEATSLGSPTILADQTPEPRNRRRDCVK